MLVKIAPGRLQLSRQWTRGGIPLKNERASWQPIPLLKNCWLQTKKKVEAQREEEEEEGEEEASDNQS